MKYNLKIISLLVSFFIFSQIIGLIFVNGSITSINISEGGRIEIEHKKTPVERPETTGAESLVFILIGIIIATSILLLLIKFNLLKIWKLWFFFAIWVTITIALAVYMDTYLAAFIAFILGGIKVLRPNTIIHNITEILIYSGIAVLFVPIFELLWVSILLFIISAYDIIAVWKTKHMIKMALFLSKNKLFAGLSFPVTKIRSKTKTSDKKIDTAILGGGDIAFPLLFTGVVLEELVKNGIDKFIALKLSLVVTIITTLMLLLLFLISKRDRFYPAMPFLTIGCIMGYLIIKLFLYL